MCVCGGGGGGGSLSVCMCVCVCMRERERVRECICLYMCTSVLFLDAHDKLLKFTWGTAVLLYNVIYIDR